MTSINIHFKTAPIALFVLAGTIILVLVYVNGMKHLDDFWNVVFILISILFLATGITLYYYSSEKFYEDQRFRVGRAINLIKL
jgi:hypothetical protein